MSLNYPLDYIYPEIFGNIDEEERYLICNGSLDLVLIENASEILRQIIQKPGIFEYILESLIKTKGDKNIEYVYSETFPYYVTNENKRRFYSEDFNAKNKDMKKKEEYFDLIDKYKKNLNLNKTLVTILSVDLEESGGHYAAFYYKNGIVYIFDSMQTEETRIYQNLDPDMFQSSGYYTPYFIQLASHIFPGKKIIIPDCIKEEVALQLTGGFQENYPLQVEKSNLSDEKKYLLSIQSTESQNHFCYLWAIWWIHLKIEALSLENLFYLRDPLIIIKKYAWCLMSSLDLFSEIDDKFLPFFQKHFMSIWSNENKLNLNFKRYKISFNKKCENVLKSFINSYADNEKLVVEENSTVPKELCN